MNPKKHFVHRYRWSHDSRRTLFRRWAKKGHVRLISQGREGFLYEECPDSDFTIVRTESRRKITYQLIGKRNDKST